MDGVTSTNLTDLADLTVLYLAHGRRFSISTETTIMAARKQPLAYKMLQYGYMIRETPLVRHVFCPGVLDID